MLSRSLQPECITLVEMGHSSPNDGQQPGLDTPGGKKVIVLLFILSLSNTRAITPTWCKGLKSWTT